LPILAPSRRPLTKPERRALQTKIRRLTASGRRASAIWLPMTAAVVFVLWIWTILASDAHWLVVTAFWLLVGGGIALWVRSDMRGHGRQFENMARGLESALRRDAADVYDVRASAFVELEELEDEGACYAFQLDGNRLVLITGQEFYSGARFPSLDFSLVHVLDETGQTVDMLIDKRGARAAPARRVPADVKRRLDVPDHLEVRIGSIDDLESLLRGTSSSPGG
jgi:hypothetical protein